MEKKPIKAYWKTSLEIQCPHCWEYIDLAEDDDSEKYGKPDDTQNIEVETNCFECGKKINVLVNNSSH